MIKIHDDEKYLEGMTFIDLFAGIGGFRLALESLGGKCVYSNEWDKAAQETYLANFGEVPEGDITKVNEKTIPDHDILCAGFPCFPGRRQSSGGLPGPGSSRPKPVFPAWDPL